MRSVIIHMPIMTYRDLARFLVFLPDGRRIHESSHCSIVTVKGQ